MSDPPPEDFDATRPPLTAMWVLRFLYTAANVAIFIGAVLAIGQAGNAPRLLFVASMFLQGALSWLLAGACMIAWRDRHAEIERWRRRRNLARLPPGHWRRNRQPFDTEPWQYVVGGVCCVFLAALWAAFAALTTGWFW